MKNYLFILSGILYAITSFAQLTLRITSIPATTPTDAMIYVAGTMNNWNPGSNTYKLVKDSTGILSVTFTPAIGTVKFKFTQGSWDKVEGTENGTFLPDRTISYTGGAKTISLTIAGWEGNTTGLNSTASPQVSIISDTFEMPQLKTKRRIWLYLPKDYTAGIKSYPVLYMHDGQNLFDRQTSYSGEWRIDESLDSMLIKGDYGCIVVGIDNGGSERLNEYSPWVNATYGGGKGAKYVEFVVNTLKPYIDATYRTLTDSDNTGMMGSSMGGLISMYAGIAYPAVFGKVGAFSSAFWFSPESFKQIYDMSVRPSSYFYLIAGAQEGGTQTQDMQKMAMALKSNGAPEPNVNSTIHTDGKHNESYWAREFPKAYKWLFEKKTNSLSKIPSDQIKVIVESGRLLFKTNLSLIGANVSVFNNTGQLLFRQVVTDTNDVALPFIDLKPMFGLVVLECDVKFWSSSVILN